MKNKFYLLLLIVTTVFSVAAQGQKKEEVCYNPNLIQDTSKGSIKSMAFAIIRGDSVKINYHSPGVRKRIIWGGLVPFDEVWVTGAHDATTLEMPKAFIINGKEIPAGKYAFFTIPGKKEWVLILNRNWKQHLATAYEEREDIIRIKVTPKKVNHTERLQYFIESGKSSAGKITMAWEMIKVEFPFILKD